MTEDLSDWPDLVARVIELSDRMLAAYPELEQSDYNDLIVPKYYAKAKKDEDHLYDELDTLVLQHYDYFKDILEMEKQIIEKEGQVEFYKLLQYNMLFFIADLEEFNPLHQLEGTAHIYKDYYGFDYIWSTTKNLVELLERVMHVNTKPTALAHECKRRLERGIRVDNNYQIFFEAASIFHSLKWTNEPAEIGLKRQRKYLDLLANTQAYTAPSFENNLPADFSIVMYLLDFMNLGFFKDNLIGFNRVFSNDAEMRTNQSIQNTILQLSRNDSRIADCIEPYLDEANMASDRFEKLHFIDNRLYAAEVFLKYMGFQKLRGKKFDPVQVAEQAAYFFMRPTEREELLKDHRDHIRDWANSMQTGYDAALKDVLKSIHLNNELNREMMDSLSNNETVVNGTRIFDVPEGYVFNLRPGWLYKYPCSCTLYREGSDANPNLHYKEFQEKLMDNLLASDFFALDESMDGVDIYFLGGGALIEERHYLKNLVLKNLDTLIKKLEQSKEDKAIKEYTINVFSVDKHMEQMEDFEAFNVRNHINYAIKEKLRNRNVLKDGKFILENPKEFFRIRINPIAVPKDFILEDYLQGDGHKHNYEALIVNLSTSISNVNDGRNNEPDERKMMMDQAYSVLSNYKKGKLILSSALRADPTDYKAEESAQFVGNMLFQNGLGIPREALFWHPEYDNTPEHRDRHDQKFDFVRAYDHEFYSNDGERCIIKFKPGNTIRITYSQRDTQESLEKLAEPKKWNSADFYQYPYPLQYPFPSQDPQFAFVVYNPKPLSYPSSSD
ncbi:MAG: hypothetical protein KKF44_03680 [Nanoarchaeota archaeon]|nr:hypothetical protein [Nanoarchaeota archaeon]